MKRSSLLKEQVNLLLKKFYEIDSLTQNKNVFSLSNLCFQRVILCFFNNKKHFKSLIVSSPIRSLSRLLLNWTHLAGQGKGLPTLRWFDFGGSHLVRLGSIQVGLGRAG